MESSIELSTNYVINLLDSGHPPNDKMPNGFTPLLYAIRLKDFPLIQLLTDEYNVNINLKDSKGDSPLDFAYTISDSVGDYLVSLGAESEFKVFDDYIASLSSEDLEALIFYTENCTIGNTLLSKKRKLVGNSAKYYTRILKIFANAPRVTKALTVYRGIGLDAEESCKDHSGFISTSRKKYVAHRFIDDSENENRSCCRFDITLPPGDYSILPLEKISSYDNEFEILLQPGNLTVVGKSLEESYKTLQCVYIPQNNVEFKVYDSIDAVNFLDYNELSDRITRDIGKYKFRQFIFDFYNKNKTQADYTRERYNDAIIIGLLSDLEYFNDIPDVFIIRFIEELAFYSREEVKKRLKKVKNNV